MKKRASLVRAPWPKGLRRNANSGQWSATLLRLRSLVDNHFARNQISYSALASVLGVDKKTVTRWRDGIDRPPIETQEAVAQWVADKRKTVAKK